MNRNLHNAMMAQYATPEVSGDGLVSWEGGKKCVIPSVKLYGAAVQDGTPTPDAPVMPVCNNGVFRGTNADGSYDGGQGTVPELWAIPGTEYRDEWDPQTGRGIRRVKKLVLDGTETIQIWNAHTTDERIAFVSRVISVDNKSEAKSNYAICSHVLYSSVYPNDVSWIYIARRNTSSLQMALPIVSVGGKTETAVKSYLAAQYAAGTPVTVWYALANPEPLTSPPAKLTMPTGYGQIIQTGGDIPNCPITAKYLTHR